MEVKSKRKVTVRTWEEKKILCEQWKNSGKTKREFCKDNNIPIASFFPWCDKLWPETKKEKTDLLPVKIINKNQTISNAEILQTDIELIFGEGPKIRFKLPIKNLVTFIQELSHAVTTIR
jgi:hypothetical protein